MIRHIFADGECLTCAADCAERLSVEGGVAKVTDRPLAIAGLTSYRYAGTFGWIMIGATDVADALREAARSLPRTTPVDARKLQVWNGRAYKADEEIPNENKEKTCPF